MELDNISIQNSNKSGLNIDGSNLNLETGDIQGSVENGIEVRNNSSLREDGRIKKTLLTSIHDKY